MGAPAAAAGSEPACWGGPATCLDGWVPEGVTYWDGLRPYYLPVICYGSIALLTTLRLAHAAAGRATARLAGRRGAEVPAFLPINAWVAALWALSFVTWAGSAPWVVDWAAGALRVDGPVLAVGQVQALLYAAACVIELAAKADGFTWLSFAHHFIAIVDVSYILTLVRNPYAITVGWLYLGNTFLEGALYTSLVAHHAAGLTDPTSAAGRRWRAASVAVNRCQLYFTAAHNLVFQASVNAYVAYHWARLSPAFRYSFLAFNVVLFLENVVCTHCSAATLVRKGAARRGERAIWRATAFARQLAVCGCCGAGGRRVAGGGGGSSSGGSSDAGDGAARAKDKDAAAPPHVFMTVTVV
jgi:hypothetical protein